MSDIKEPMNVTEEYLYGINVRLNILIEQVSALTEAYSKVNNLATESTQVTQQPTTRSRKGR